MLGEEYRIHPACQQAVTTDWILQAKRSETGDKRLQQMPDEPERGRICMRTEIRPSGK